MTKIYFSSKAYQNGFGSAPHKSVCGQTTEERQIVKDGGVVIFDCGRLSGGSYGTPLRQITFNKGYWNPRVPSDDVLAAYAQGKYEFSS